MSFGLLKHFKDSKSGAADKVSSKHYRHIIIGQDLGAVLRLVEIRKSFPDESVRLITSRPINRQNLIENYEFGVSHLRSASAVEAIYRKFHNAKIMPQQKEASFYKDGKFHDFGGRAKSMELQTGEDFFIGKGYKLELAGLFSTEDWENLDQILKDHSEIRIFEAIEKTTPDELVDKKEWRLSFKDFSILTAENLYVSLSPKKFLNLLQNKEQLTPELIDVCSSVRVQAAISVTWKLNKEIYPEEKTLFIPQSMTHEWGHFLVEFESYNYQNKEQLCHVLFLIHEEEPQSEDLAAKIKLMKRVLDRVFPDIEKHISKEYIRFDDEMFISDVKDAAIEQMAFDFPTLRFLGQAAPMSADHTQEKFLSRVLL
ncbi:hypothetical protein ACJVC5_03235 [Peredibacter sp. HCB2-198]|uniref:hypothetical protein n=1 Tax=Peredibacter sp. HCB2-198 TaxID=3383025 RepID=UPI0038B64727